jgi:hypothetical protein
MAFLSYGVTRILKPIVSFSIGTISDLMSALVLYGLLYVALDDRLGPLLFGLN